MQQTEEPTGPRFHDSFPQKSSLWYVTLSLSAQGKMECGWKRGNFNNVFITFYRFITSSNYVPSEIPNSHDRRESKIEL
jgi:hypothetical protein